MTFSQRVFFVERVIVIEVVFFLRDFIVIVIRLPQIAIDHHTMKHNSYKIIITLTIRLSYYSHKTVMSCYNSPSQTFSLQLRVLSFNMTYEYMLSCQFYVSFITIDLLTDLRRDMTSYREYRHRNIRDLHRDETLLGDIIHSQ